MSLERVLDRSCSGRRRHRVRQGLVGLQELDGLVQQRRLSARMGQALLVAREVERPIQGNAVRAVLDGQLANRGGG